MIRLIKRLLGVSKSTQDIKTRPSALSGRQKGINVCCICSPAKYGAAGTSICKECVRGIYALAYKSPRTPCILCKGQALSVHCPHCFGTGVEHHPSESDQDFIKNTKGINS